MAEMITDKDAKHLPTDPKTSKNIYRIDIHRHAKTQQNAGLCA